MIQSYEAVGIGDTLDAFFPGVEGTTRDTNRKSVYLWVKNKPKIVNMCSTIDGGSKRCSRERGLGTSLSADAEMDLVRWVNDYRDVGAPVSSLMLRLRALRVAEETGVPRGFFEASREWQRGFLKRHCLSFRAKTRQGQISPKDSEAMAARFTVQLRERMHNLKIDVAFNADQTPVFFEYIPTSTIENKGAKTVWVRSSGRDKERLTCMVLGSLHGEKRTPFLVLKTQPSREPATAMLNTLERHGFGKRLWKEVAALQEEFKVQIYGNATGWWNSMLSVAFLNYNFAARANMSVPVLLLWDDFSSHWTDEVTDCAKALNVQLMKIPPSYTSVCQPADVAWNKPLKQRIRGAWVEDLQQQLDTAGREAFKLVPPDRRKVVGWISKAWDSLHTNTISNGFSCITKEPAVDSDLMEKCDVLAKQLDSLNLLDVNIGEVGDDIVDEHLSQDLEK